jgi:hypothetical protein
VHLGHLGIKGLSKAFVIIFFKYLSKNKYNINKKGRKTKEDLS